MRAIGKIMAQIVVFVAEQANCSFCGRTSSRWYRERLATLGGIADNSGCIGSANSVATNPQRSHARAKSRAAASPCFAGTSEMLPDDSIESALGNEQAPNRRFAEEKTGWVLSRGFRRRPILTAAPDEQP
jgi:hypothetical protein